MQRAESAAVGWTRGELRASRVELRALRSPPCRPATRRAPAATSRPFATPIVGSAKIAGELTTAACSGCASGILMTSMRKFELFGSQGLSLQRASSSDGRMPDVPEM